MTVICAWCKKILQETKEGTGFSHGICKACEEKYFKK